MDHCRIFIDYFFHNLTSKTRHGVHSPFVYRLVDEVIYDYSFRAYELEIEDLHASLKKGRRVVKVNNSPIDSVESEIKGKEIRVLVTHALKPLRISKLIARLAAFLKPSTIVELGTGFGVTAALLAKALPSSQVLTIDSCLETTMLAKESFAALGLNNIEVKIGTVDSLFDQVYEELESLDFLLINDCLDSEAVWTYFKLCLPKVHEGTILIIDGIHQGRKMRELWNDIKHHPKVTVTIDLFHIGLVFFKTDQEKEHFKIRFL